MTGIVKAETQSVTEFGVGVENDEGLYLVLVPIDDKIQTALKEMVTQTRAQLSTMDPVSYEPSDKHGGTEHLHLALDDDLASQIRLIHEANNLPVDGKVLSDPSDVFFYFTRIVDGKGNRTTGIRRASTFKGILKTRLVQLTTDALKIVEDKVFRLDTDFDLLVDASGVSILRPSGFEIVGALTRAIQAAAPENIKLIQKDLPFVDFSVIAAYASKHPRAARYLASIRMQKQSANIDKASLKDLCKKTGVLIREEKGKLIVEDGSVMDFLGVLDRRLYQVELVKGSPESFRAASRSRIGTGS
jgi:Domain of unknown function (DUF4868)